MRRRCVKFSNKKQKGVTIRPAAPAAASSNVVNLMDALKKSLVEGGKSTARRAPETVKGAREEGYAIKRSLTKGRVMRSPSIAPSGFDVDVYVVLDDFGKLGRSYRETDEEAATKKRSSAT